MRLLILLLVLQVSTALAVSETSVNTWTRIETQNFEFVGDAPEVAIRDTAERLERFREALSRVLPIGARSAKTRVILFKDAVSFKPFKPLRPDGTVDERVRGLLVTGEDINCIALSADNLELGTIFHEYVHDVIATEFGDAQVPAWLNEGLATYFQNFQMADDKTATFGTPRLEFVALLRTSPLISWDEFFALDNFTLHRESIDQRPVFYAQAWALTSYLVSLSEDTGKPINLSSLTSAASRLDRMTLGEKLGFAATPKAARSVKFVGTSPIVQVSTTPVAEAEFSSVLADLSFRLRKTHTEAYLRRASEMDTKLASPFVTLGQLRLRERKFDEAKAAFEKAITLDSRNYLAHYYHAFLLYQENLDEAAILRPLKPETARSIVDSLNRSIVLKSEFAQSHYLLGTIELASGNLPAAETAMRRAVGLKPGKANYSLQLARILLRQERVNDAIAITQPLASQSGDSRTATEAKAILANANELLMAKAAVDRGRQLEFRGARPLEILRYSDLTPEQVAKIDRDRENYNHNVLVERPGATDGHTVGFVDRVECVDDRIEFKIRFGMNRLTLTARKFDDVRYRVVVPGTRSYAFRCGSRFANDLALIVYKSSAGKPSIAGEVLAITFVPSDFEFLSAQQLRDAPYYVVEGRPSGDISQNEAISVKEREEMEREMRETQLRDIEERLRQPQVGEERIIGTPEKMECRAGRMNVSVKAGDASRVFSTPISKPFEIQSFNSGAQLIETGCLAQLPSLPAVITFKTAGSELISVEFVPAYFKLR